jgi:sugar/nucleoside kinase (ribokinase family)
VLFDPGPRSWTFIDGGVRRHALQSMLRIADVVLMTEEEAGAVVGTEDAEEAVRRLMEWEDSSGRPACRGAW